MPELTRLRVRRLKQYLFVRFVTVNVLVMMIQRMFQYKELPEVGEWNKLEESPVFNNGNELREYQLEGVNWLTFNYYSR